MVQASRLDPHARGTPIVKPKTTSLVFYETEQWEEERLQQNLAGSDLRLSHAVLDDRTDDLAREAEIVSVFVHSLVTRNRLARMPKLRLLATRSTGFDHIDLAACTERGIVVCNVPAYGTNTVAEHTFGLILALSRNIHKAYVRTVRGDFSLKGLIGFDLKGKTLGVVGAGNIGLHVIRIARGFGMRVLAYDVRPSPLMAEVLGFEYVPLETMLRQADIVTLHCPYTAENYHMIGRDSMGLMKRGALLINTARGGLVDTDALIWALDEGILAGAGLDVLEGEELIKEEKQLLAVPSAEEKLRSVLRQHLLLRREDVVVTPHIAFYSHEALERIIDTTADNIRGFTSGRPANVVNPEVLAAAPKAA